MSEEKKEKTQTITNFSYNIDTENSEQNEVPTITNLLGRKKLKIQPAEKEQKNSIQSFSASTDQHSTTTQAPSPPPKETKNKNEEDEKTITAAGLGAIELIAPPDDSYHFKTNTGFDKNLPLKENSQILNTPYLKKVTPLRSKSIKASLSKNEIKPQQKNFISQFIEDLMGSGAHCVLYLKKSPENTYKAILYQGPIHYYRLWQGIEYKKSLYPEFYDETLKETAVSKLDKLKSKNNIINIFGLDKTQSHFYAHLKHPDQDNGFFIISGNSSIEGKIKTLFLKQNNSTKAA